MTESSNGGGIEETGTLADRLATAWRDPAPANRNPPEVEPSDSLDADIGTDLIEPDVIDLDPIEAEPDPVDADPIDADPIDAEPMDSEDIELADLSAFWLPGDDDADAEAGAAEAQDAGLTPPIVVSELARPLAPTPVVPIPEPNPVAAAPTAPTIRPRVQEPQQPGAHVRYATEPRRGQHIESTRVVARARAAISLLVVVVLAGVGLAAAVGVAVAVLVLALRRAVGG